jgi:nucleoid-associated protein YgaU
VEPKITTTVVSRGDSLWRISRVTYGAGTQYAAVYKANRDRIQDPDRIFPGQIFILPMKAR